MTIRNSSNGILTSSGKTWNDYWLGWWWVQPSKSRADDQNFVNLWAPRRRFSHHWNVLRQNENLRLKGGYPFRYLGRRFHGHSLCEWWPQARVSKLRLMFCPTTVHVELKSCTSKLAPESFGQRTPGDHQVRGCWQGCAWQSHHQPVKTSARAVPREPTVGWPVKSSKLHCHDKSPNFYSLATPFDSHKTSFNTNQALCGNLCMPLVGTEGQEVAGVWLFFVVLLSSNMAQPFGFRRLLKGESTMQNVVFTPHQMHQACSIVLASGCSVVLCSQSSLPTAASSALLHFWAFE